MRGYFLSRIFNWYTAICCIVAVCLMLFLFCVRSSTTILFQGFSAANSMGRLDLLKTMEWNLCILPPVSASLLFIAPELGVLSTYTVLRTSTMRRWWLARFGAMAMINYVFFFFALGVLTLFAGNTMQWAQWLPTAALFPLHTTVLSALCCCGILLSSSRAAVIIYLLIEAGLLLIGLALPPVSLFLIPYWGMVQAMGSSWGYAVVGSLFFLAAFNTGIIWWLGRHNPAENSKNK